MKQGSCRSDVNIITRVVRNRKRANARKYLRGFGDLCSSVACNQGPVTLIFNTTTCRLQPRAANNRINTEVLSMRTHCDGVGGKIYQEKYLKMIIVPGD